MTTPHQNAAEEIALKWAVKKRPVYGFFTITDGDRCYDCFSEMDAERLCDELNAPPALSKERELREALKPFAHAAEIITANMKDETAIWHRSSTIEGDSFSLTIGHCRAARAALQPAQPAQPKTENL